MSVRGLIDRIRGWQPPLGDGRANEDWATGDLAACVEADDWINLETGGPSTGPKKGDLVRVAGIKISLGWLMLKFEGWPHDWYTAVNFRKVRPDNRDAASRGFIQRLKNCRPKVGA